MNEIKRQLNKKVGSTSRRTERVIKKVNEKKRHAQQPSKFNRLYYATFTAFLALIALTVFVMQPWSTNDSHQAILPPREVNESNIGEKPNLQIRRYFKQDGDIAYFLGSGNEYAGFTEITTWLSDEYIEIQEDNTGAIMQKIYRIKQNAIELVYEEMMEREKKSFTLAELNQLKSIRTILKLPVIDGATFENKTISYPVNFRTPYKNYDNVIQITEEVEGGKNYYYYDEDNGLIAKRFITNDGYEVLSVLRTINGTSTKTTEEAVTFKNMKTNQVETLPLSKTRFLDPLLSYQSNAEKFKMTYEPLFTYKDAEIGVFKYDCVELFCELAFVNRIGEDITFGSLVWGNLQSFKRSPNLENVIFSITLDEIYEGAFLNRTMLHIVNINTMEKKVPSSLTYYFSDPFYPIIHYDWIDDTTIQAEVADVDDYESESILNWQQSQEKKTKVIEVSLLY